MAPLTPFGTFLRDYCIEVLEQVALTDSLGQVTCGDERQHDVANLPCRRCGAAL